MIRVTIELLPHGLEIGRKVLATCDIANDGLHLLRPAFGSYTARLYVHQTKSGKPRLWRRARVVEMNRQRRGVWDLLQLVLHDALGNRNRGAMR
jgi:hypothetical protein